VDTTAHRRDCPCYYQMLWPVVAWAILPVL
jgi:hypothetical protein